MSTERHELSQWRRSSYCYDGTCVEVCTSDGMVFLRDSKRPNRPAIALAFSEWAAFMAMVRDARWGDSFDVTTVAAPRAETHADRASAVPKPDNVLI